MAGRHEKFRGRKTSKRVTSNLKKNGYAFPKRRTSSLYHKPKPKFDGTGGFEFDRRGGIKGTYVDGKFEPW